MQFKTRELVLKPKKRPSTTSKYIIGLTFVNIMVPKSLQLRMKGVCGRPDAQGCAPAGQISGGE